MTAITSLARAAARECSLCEQVPASIEVRCRHSNASRAALWLQQKHCTALCSKGDTTIELAGRLFLLTPHVVALGTSPGLGIIEPCLPSPAKAPPSGPGWLHEIKHDGFRILARRDPAGVRLITRAGNDFSSRLPFITMAVSKLPVRSCLIDGEAIVTNSNGLAVFDLIRGHGTKASAVLCAFDLLELDGKDLRREPIENRKALLAKLLKGSHSSVANH